MNANTDVRLTEEYFQRTGLAADFSSAARLGIYVHVPFCPHICPYCDFVKTARFTGADIKSYFRHLEEQFDVLIEQIPDTIECATLYLGGGTPSLFSAHHYERLVEKVKARFSLVEFTVETNPYTNAETGLKAFAGLGVNRITLGAQSLNQSALKYLGRKHTPQHVFQSINAALNAGIEQIQVDLIFGLKKLSEKRLIEEEIRQLSDAGATGVSCYLLTIEQSTAFKAESTAIDESIVDEYTTILRVCEQLGYVQFETSNFSKTAPIHNRLYWYGLPYLGLGTGHTDYCLPSGNFRLDSAIVWVVFQWRHARVMISSALLWVAKLCLSLAGMKRSAPLRTIARKWCSHCYEPSMESLMSWFNNVFPHHARQQLWNNGKITRAEHEGLIIRDEHHVRLAPHEKIRGDSWAVQILTELQRSSSESE